MDYAIVIAKLSEEEGGGYIGYVPDLTGCLSDGETPEEALKNTREAIGEWIESYSEIGREIPKPGSAIAAARAERSKVIASFKDALEKVERLDEQVDLLASDVRYLEEVAEHFEANVRFSALTGVPLANVGAPRTRRTKAC